MLVRDISESNAPSENARLARGAVSGCDEPKEGPAVGSCGEQGFACAWSLKESEASVDFAASRPKSVAPELVLPLRVRVVASSARFWFSRCSAAELLGRIAPGR